MDTTDVIWLLVSLLAGAALGAVVMWQARSSAVARWRLRATELDGAVQELRTENSHLRTRQAEERSLADLLGPVRDSVEGLRRASDAASRERTVAETQIRDQLAGVEQRNAVLAAATTQLAGALAKGGTRGRWGEMQLEGILTHSGLLEGTHFRRQDTREGDLGGARPDVVVLLPGGGEVVIDAKVPLDAYLLAIDSTDPREREQLLRKHAADVLARANELARKRYSDAEASLDFTVMFLPLESLLSSALEVDPTLLERAFDKRVVLATPTTLLALLRTIGFGYQREQMAQNADEIKRLGTEMLSRLGKLAEHLEVMRRGLDQAVRGYNSFVGSFDTQALAQARRMNELGVDATRPLEAPAPVDTAVRETVHLSLSA